MVKITIADYSEAELRSRRRTTAFVLAIVAVMVCAAVWSSVATNSTQLTRSSPRTAAQNAPALVAHWNSHLAPLQKSLPSTDDDKAIESLRPAIEKLNAEFSTLRIPVDSPVGQELTDELAKLTARAAEYVADRGTQSTPTEATDVARRIAAAVRQRGIHKASETKHFVEQRVANLRATREPEIRLGELNVRDAVDKVVRLKSRLDQEIENRKKELAKAQRAAALERDMAEVRATLSPFITPGHVQPREAGKSYKLETTVEAKPVSLERLQRTGALDSTNEGLDRLFRFGGSRKTQGSDRPLGTFPEYGWAGDINKPGIRQRVLRAQYLLRTHGQALVESRRLSP
ncbi:MAG: S46 family peptidase [Planctomycetales bacterium]|nr:S46 family peptidase [Planctomycetales bacterium]MCA9166550.1 S46 family peptidase [Planctomycetales bacterium]